MKYLKKFKLFESSEEEINSTHFPHAVCRKYSIENYTINTDGSIDVNGNVGLSSRGLTKIPLKFNKVDGWFDCKFNQLTSLLGAPKEVGRGFYCENNQLTSLEGAPERNGGGFYFQNNKIINIDGLLWKSFKRIYLSGNPVYPIVSEWINKDNHEELIEYFVDLGVIQGETLIMDRLRAFHEEMDLEMEINFEEVKKYYTIIN